jgi:hypothetical protein
MIEEYVTCITHDAGGGSAWRYLTKGKKYLLIKEFTNNLLIKDDSGGEYRYPIRNFKTIQEIRDLKLNKLGI